jgi:predicted nucleic acid-binding protein
MTPLPKALAGQKIALDTMVFIYAFEEHPVYLSLLRALFSALEKGDFEAITSTVTITECLTLPYRQKNFGLAAQYMVLFRNFPHLTAVPVTDEVAERAALLRARYKIGTPDALQLATALVSRAAILLTNDENLSAIKDIRVLTLDEIA